MSREFDYTIVESYPTRFVIDWELNRAYDATRWTWAEREEFRTGNLVVRRGMVRTLSVVKLTSWVVDVDPWDYF